ncbi:MAG: hypothetical protein CMO66_07835 [Verrucomicrobiales bacterium]|nr:hypothetical protein [Verrucomicrobiales bacterium]
MTVPGNPPPEELPTTPPARQEETQSPVDLAPAVKPRPTRKKRRAARLNTCNVIDCTRDHQQFWRFTPGGRGMKLAEVRDDPDLMAEVPTQFTRRDTSQMWDPHCQNDAWLPMEKVFFRVLRLPACEPEELPDMVELQLEKISPLPVAQVVWTFEVVSPPPGTAQGQQVVVVILAERSMVEDQVGHLESIGYRPDRLEVPVLHQVLAAPVEVDDVNGAWIYPRLLDGRPVCLVAWWSGGELRNINVAHLSSRDHLNELTEHLTSSAWAAELEGWAPAMWNWNLVADRELAEEWLPLLNEWAGRGVTQHDPPETVALAAACAHRASRPLGEANLLPPEFRDRYHRDDVDRVWLNVAGWVVAAYALFVGLYFFALGDLRDEQNDTARDRRKLQREHKGMALEEERYLKKLEYDELRKKALECMEAIGNNKPLEMQLITLTFNDRKDSRQNLTLTGSVPTDLDQLVGTFKDGMLESRVANLDKEMTRLFSEVQEGSIVEVPIAGDPMKRWTLNCELAMNRQKRKKDD